MQSNAVSQSSSTTSSTTAVTNPNSSLDKNAFMKILIAQLQHQDPLQPMQDRDFVAQMAQFSALEQMTNVSTTMASLQKVNSLGAAYGLLGAKVTGYDAKNNLVTGVVTGMEMIDGVSKIKIGDAFMDLTSITKVEK